MYADDTASLFTGETLSVMQAEVMDDLSSISSQFAENKLTLNSNKSKYVVFCSRRNNDDTSRISIILNNSSIQEIGTISGDHF